MRKNNLKDKLKHRQATFGGWITSGSEVLTEIMAKMPFDWLAVDMEHSATTLAQAQNLIRIIDLCGSIPLVRVSSNDEVLIKRVMDAGAYGVIVPMVNSAQEAQRAVEAVRYPPKGRRGVGLARAQGYGVSFHEYKNWVSRESVVIVQIEHVEAVENLEEILNVEGVDGFIVGPYDLSGSLGRPGEFSHPLVKKNLSKVMEVARRMRANAGIHVIEPNADEVLLRIKQGFKFIAVSLDTLVFTRHCEALLKKVNRRRK